MDLVIHGHFVDSKQDFIGTVEVKNGVITKIVKDGSQGTSGLQFDDSCLIFPGMGDIHVHAREDETGTQCYKEDYDTCQSAAIQGGVVHISAMPNTPQPLLSEEQLAWHKNRCSGLDVFVLNYAGVGPGTKPLDSSVPYKAYTGPSVGPLFFKNEAELREVLQNYKGKPVSFHVEDYEVLIKHANEPSHDKRRPVEAVEVALKYVLEMIEEFNLNAKLCHWSCGDISFDMIRRHREKGFKTTIERLKEGFIDYIATDHAPHTLHEKFKNFQSSSASTQHVDEIRDTNEEEYLTLLQNNPEECKSKCLKNGTSGTPQLDTYGLITTWLMHEHHFTPQEIARVACKNPGTFVNQFLTPDVPKFGEIKEGYAGSFTVINNNKTALVERKHLKTKARWSPFENIVFPGSVEATIIRGKVFKVDQ